MDKSTPTLTDEQRAELAAALTGGIAAARQDGPAPEWWGWFVTNKGGQQHTLSLIARMVADAEQRGRAAQLTPTERRDIAAVYGYECGYETGRAEVSAAVEAVLGVEVEVHWAVRWSPSWELVETGVKPPWQADYEMWLHSTDAVVYRRKVTTTTTASDWTEHVTPPASTERGEQP